MTAEAIFLVTIDTEGDDLWRWKYPQSITTENAKHLPRFQALCEAFGFKPTYLTNYEMAIDSTFLAFGRSVIANRTAEIGLHVHAWNSPPLTGNPDWDCHQCYITELPADVVFLKMERLTNLLEDAFGVRPLSHRAGRYGFNGQVAKVLDALGYLVDCSVTPGMSWAGFAGAKNGRGGENFEAFSRAPYLLDLDDISRPGSSRVLEIPVTIRPNHSRPLQALRRRAGPLAERILSAFCGPATSWLRPNGHNLAELKSVVDWALDVEPRVIELILHSSELMAGGSPNFATDADIGRLYEDLEQLFAHIVSRGASGATLTEYRHQWHAQP